jgi:hypothetical protein
MRKLITVIAFLPLVAISQQKSDSIFIRKISNEILAKGEAYENLRYLTKQIGGRLAGSKQYDQAALWGKSVMEKAGADAVFLQECMVPHWVRGGQDKASIVSINNKKQNRKLDVLALGNSLGSGKKGVTAEVIAVANFDELEKRKNELKGKIVFYNHAFDPTNLRPGTSYGQGGAYRRNGASRAAKYGAIGVLIRSLTEATDNNPHTGAMAYNDSFPKIPAVALGLQDADYLWNACNENKSVKVSFTTYGYFLPDDVDHNVIAEIRGTENPNSFITVGGHLDSWDVNEGAHDDGTGIVQTIEILRAFKALGYKPKNSIRFVLFANEENGLRGGDKYAEVAKAKGEKHIFALESDGGGFTPRGFGFTMSADKVKKIQPWVELLTPYGVYELTSGGGGADIGPLNRTFNTPLAGLQVDNQRYFDLHHARSDVFEAVNKRELNLGTINMAALIYLVDKYGL